MEPAPPASAGFFASLRSLGDGLFGAMQNRVELFALELQQEKLQLIQTLFWISAIVFSAMMALIFGSFTLVWFFWDSARLTVLESMTALYAIVLATLLVMFRGYLARQALPFIGTLEELSRDRTCIRKAP
jgi:uncharacterized membrane protein YqjE